MENKDIRDCLLALAAAVEVVGARTYLMIGDDAWRVVENAVTEVKRRVTDGTA
jgi:hypothetical protein